MKLTLPPEIQKLIDERVGSGRYKTPEDVVAAALVTLEQQEQLGEFAAGEMDRLLAEGEAGGADLDGEEVFRELRELRERGKSKAG